MQKINKISMIMVSLLLGIACPVAVLAAGPLPVNLGDAGNFAILAKTGVSTTGSTSVTGNIGLSPAAASYITGFSPTLPAASAFATSSLVAGKIYAPGYANPTSSSLTAAVNNMQNAYTDAAGRTNPTSTELGAGNIGGMTLAPGLYKWGTGVTIPTDLTLSGGANDVWIFQIAQNLTTSSATHIILSGGAQASNIFWQVAGQATLGTTSIFYGNILSQTGIVLNTGAVLHGRALAQSAVTLDSNSVNVPVLVVNTEPITVNSTYSNGLGSTVAVSTTTNVTPSEPTMAGCNGKTGFSATTGLSCSGNTTTVTVTTPVVIAGCNNGTSGFSSVNGQSCTGNTGTITSTTSYNFGTVTLRNGSKGESVKELQKFLNKFLKMNLKEDGLLGPKTIAVIKKWQKDHGLVADGLIGAKTKALMNKEAEGN